MSARQNAKRRGRSFEVTIRDRLGGFDAPGRDGDVVARGWYIECKNLAALNAPLKQVATYEEKHPDRRYALAFKGKGRTQIWVAIPLEDFDAFTKEHHDPSTNT